MKETNKPSQEDHRNLAFSTDPRDDVAALLGRILARHWLRKRAESHAKQSANLIPNTTDLGDDLKQRS